MLARFMASREFDQKVFDYIEQQMEESSKSYFETILNFIKWNTAISVGSVLWLGNYIATSTTILAQTPKYFVLFSFLFFIGSVVISVGIFYDISRHFKDCWILNTRWRQSYLTSTSSCPTSDEQKEIIGTISELSEHVKNFPKKAESFDNWVIVQMLLQVFGLISFFALIVMIKII
jgi:hypothetical protein